MSKVLGFIVGAIEIVIGVITIEAGGFALIVGGIATIAGSALQLILGRSTAHLPENQSVKANVRGTSETHNVVFGKARVGGIIIKLGTFASAGETTTNHLLIALAHSISHPGGCDGIERIWLDDREIPLANLTRTTTSGVLTSVPNAGVNLNNFSAVTYPGTATQTADPKLVAQGLATSNDKGLGICYTVFELYRDPNNNDGFNKAYNGHIPQLTVELRGWKCYDPRLDSTNGGAGTQRVATPTTWAWSDNPALAAATYMIAARSDGGMGVPSTEIDWSYVASAANVCDQAITTPAGSQKRYRVSAALSTGDKRNDNLTKLLDSMFGVCVRVGALFRIYAGAYANPTDTITDAWLGGDLSVVPKTALSQLYNAVRVTFTDELQGYRQIETAPFTSATFEGQDGGDRLFRNITYDTCPDAYQAQYLGAIAGAKSRRQMLVTLQLNWRGLNLEPWQTVSLNLSGVANVNAKVFRLVAWSWTANGPQVQLSEDNSGDYALPTFTLNSVPSPTTDAIYAQPAAVTSLTDTAVADGVNLRWVEAGTSELRKVVNRSPAGAGTFTVIGTTYANTWHDAVTDGSAYDYKVNVVSDYGVTSPDSAIVNSAAKTSADGQPVDSIKHVGSAVIGAGNKYSYRQILTPAYVIATGDQLVYEMLSDIGNPAHTIGIDFHCSDGTLLRGSGLVDQNGYGAAPSVDTSAYAGRWYRRVISLSSLATKTITSIATALEGDATGDYVARFANIRIVSSSGALQLNIFSDTARTAVLNAPIWSFAGETGYVNVRMTSVDNDTLDAVGDGPTYARILGTQLSVGLHRLTIAGSGLTLGDMRNTPAIVSAGILGYTGNIAISSSYDGSVPANVTFSTTAGSVVLGSASVSYSAASASVTQSRSSTVTWYLYWDDPTYSGGAKTLVATSAPANVASGDGRVYLGKVGLTVPGTGGGPGAGGGCVAETAFTPDGRLFHDLRERDQLLLADCDDLEPATGLIEMIRRELQPCARLVALNGAALTCSLSAPIAVRGRGYVRVHALQIGDQVATLLDGAAGWSALGAIVDLGEIWVRPLHVGDRAFWAGESPHACILHHNYKP